MFGSFNSARAFGLALAISIGLGASSAKADEPAAPATDSTVNDFAEEAFKKYEAGAFVDAIGLYLRAYEVSKDPRILFNIGQIYEKRLHENELAITFYRRYLKTDGQESQLAKRALDRIAALNAEPSTKPNAQPASPAIPATPAPAPSPPPSRGGSTGAIVAWSATGALVIGAVVTGVVALSASSDVKNASFVGVAPESVDSASSRAKTFGIVTDVLAGSAIVGAGVALYLTLSSGSKSAQATLRGNPWLIGQF